MTQTEGVDLEPRPGQVLEGPEFPEPMRIETVRALAPGNWELGLVGTRSDRFRRVNLTTEQFRNLMVIQPEGSFDGDGRLLTLGLQAYFLGIAYEFDPFFGLSVSRVDPLPHQLEAVYGYLIKLPRVRFLLADDAGAGKTIMAGLLLRELELRGLVERVLIVTPANLTFQWQRELQDRFGAKFRILRGADIHQQYGINQWLENPRIITSLDLAKREDILPGLKQVHWDLVIVDEAHRMSAIDESKKSLRYKLGELLRDTSDHILLLTATPHKGDPKNFTLFLQLLDRDAYADVRSINQAMARGRAPFYLRRTKEAMVYFPERQPDGTWAARAIFTKRIAHTAEFKIDGAEFELYTALTRFVKQQSSRAASLDDPRARAVGFLMSLYQRRLASSTYAIRRSLEHRIERLKALLKSGRIADQEAPDVPDADELEEMSEEEQVKLENKLEAVTIAATEQQLRDEIQQLEALVAQARAVEQSGQEAKLAKLRELIEEQGFFAERDKRLLIFTEFKDTLDYLVRKLSSWGLRVGAIHGGMKIGSRDEPGTRLFMEQQFREGAIQVLVATEAAGEGINLQVCNILFNYDIPWNPNRLEQRMGRIHRYGQTKDCLIFNFVAINTVEGRVLDKLLKRLQEIRNALNNDAVFNVVGEVLPASHIERILRDYYAGRLGDQDLEDRMLRDVDERKFREICENALEGLASKSLNLPMLLEWRAKAQEHRLVPEIVARFMREAAEHVDSLTLRPARNLRHTFEDVRVPERLRAYEREDGWRLPPLARSYPRVTTDRAVAEEHRDIEWVTPGHPLFEAIRRHVHDKAQPDLRRGATFYSLNHAEPARIDVYRARVVDGLGHTIRERLFAVEVAEGREPLCREVANLFHLLFYRFGLDLVPGKPPAQLPSVTAVEIPGEWLHEHVLAPFLEETRQERLGEVERVAEHVEIALGELLARADEEVGRAWEARERGEQGAEGRLAKAETRHAELWQRLERRRRELEQQRALTLQAVDRITSVLVLPHPEREAPEVRRMRPNPETEAVAMRVVMEYERAQGRTPSDVHERNLGYDITSVDLNTGELRLIEVKGLEGPEGFIPLTPNERRVAEDRRDCYWLYVVTNCATTPELQEPIKDPARFPWNAVTKIEHYTLPLDRLVQQRHDAGQRHPEGAGA